VREQKQRRLRAGGKKKLYSLLGVGVGAGASGAEPLSRVVMPGPRVCGCLVIFTPESSNFYSVAAADVTSVSAAAAVEIVDIFSQSLMDGVILNQCENFLYRNKAGS